MRTKMEGIIIEDQRDIEKGGENSYLDNIAASLKKEFDRLPRLSTKCSIYRVPERLRCMNGQIYTPKVVSIGPLHHSSQKLKVMEDHKLRYLRAFLDRTEKRIEVYIDIIKIKEEDLRNCYPVEDVVKIHSDEFVKIILVDAAFVIEIILRSYGWKKLDNNENDHVFEKPWLFNSIMPDMFLLENQLPFFILEDLYMTGGVSQNKLIDLAYAFFMYSIPDLEQTDDVYKDKISSSEVKHLVDLLRTLHLPSSVRQGLTEDNLGRKSSSSPKLQFGEDNLHQPLLNESQNPLPPLTEEKEEEDPASIKWYNMTLTYLHRAGVKLKVESKKSLLEIQFENGILKIPKIKMHDYTELLLRNLIAFEQCQYMNDLEQGSYLGDYVYTLDQFVNTADDVKLLVEAKVVENMLGDNKQVSDMINRLGVGVLVSPNHHYSTCFEDLNEYCEKTWHKWMATLMQDYFNTPWALISFIAAALLLLLGIISTVCAMISVTS